MFIPKVFSRLCLFFLLFTQALHTAAIWDVWPGELFGSRVLHNVLGHIARLDLGGWVVLLVLGILLVALHMKREHHIGPNAAWALSGVMYLILAPVTVVLICMSQPEDLSELPSTHQFVSIAVMVVLDIAVLIAIGRFVRSRNQSANAAE